MKKILLLAVIVCAILSCKAQTPLFPNTTKLRQYNNQWITNDAYRAFSQKRLNTLLNGMIDWIDSARASGGGEGGGGGIDTLVLVNDSTFRYFKEGDPRDITVKGVYDGRRKVDTLYKPNDSTLRVFVNGSPTDIFIGTSIEGATRGYVDSVFAIVPQGTVYIGWGLRGGNTFDNPIEADSTELITPFQLYTVIDSTAQALEALIADAGGLSEVSHDATLINQGTPGSLLGVDTISLVMSIDRTYKLLDSLAQEVGATPPDGTETKVTVVTPGLSITGTGTIADPYRLTNTGTPGSNPFNAYLITGLVSDVVAPGSGPTVTGTNNTPILQAAINAAADGQLIIVPHGNYLFSTPLDTLKGPKSVNLLILGNTYHNGSDFIIMANAGGLTENHVIVHLGDCIGRINSPSFTSANYIAGTNPQWSTYTGVPFKFYNSNQHQVKFNKVAGFKAPVEAIGWDYDAAGRGLEEAYIEGREVRDCANGIILTSINGRSFVDKVYYTGWGGGLVTVRAGLGIKIDGYSGAAPNGEIYNGAFRSCEFHMLIERCDSIAEAHGDITEALFDVTVEGSAVHSAVGWRMRSVTPNYVRDPVYTGRGVFGYDWVQQGMGLNAQGFVPVWNSSAGRRYSNYWKTDGSGNFIFIGSTLTKAQRDASPPAFLYAPGNDAVVYKSITSSTYTAAPGEVIQYSNASGTITAPSASANIGRRFTVQNIHGSIAVTISGVANYTSIPAGDNMTWESNGTDWRGVVNAEGTGGGGSGQFVTDANGINSNGARTGIQTNSSASTALNVAASTTSQSSLRLLTGAHPTAPVNGDIWHVLGRLFFSYNSIVKEIFTVPDNGIAYDVIRRTATNDGYEHVQSNYKMKASATGQSGNITSLGATTLLNGGFMETVPNGSKYVFEATGTINTTANDQPNFVFRLGSQLVLVLFPQFPSGMASRNFKLIFECTKRSTGYYWEAEMKIDNGSLTTDELLQGSSSNTLPSTGSLTAEFDWDASGNTLVINNATWEVKRWQ